MCFYLWSQWAFVAARRAGAAPGGGAPASRRSGFCAADRRPWAHWRQELQYWGSAVVALGLTFSVACEISPDSRPLRRQANAHSL